MMDMTNTAITTAPTTIAAEVTGSALVAAVEAFWSKLVESYPELPSRVIVVTGSGAKGYGLVRGHWAIGRWQGTDAERIPELFISGERMADGGRGVATTIIHEAAHALIQARGDMSGGTSRQGRYHTRKGFAAAAGELGLTAPTKANPTLGFSDCTMPELTATRWADEIAALDAALSATIMTLDAETLRAWSVVLGFLFGAGATIVPWWATTDPAAALDAAGGKVKAPKAPRVRRPKVTLACDCRSIKVSEAEAEALEELECRRCAAELVRKD